LKGVPAMRHWTVERFVVRVNKDEVDKKIDMPITERELAYIVRIDGMV